MGKRAEQAKKRKRLANVPVAPIIQDEDAFISADDLAITIETLKALAETPSELADKSMKELKRTLFDLQRVMAEGSTLGSSLTSRISCALRDYRFQDALVLLYEMYVRQTPPKLGALQRWVRECDATSTVDTLPDSDAMKCLDLILRIAGGRQVAANVDPNQFELKQNPTWSARDDMPGEIRIWEKMTAGTLFDTPPTLPYPGFRAVQHTPGHLRRPPNVYDSTVYGSSNDAIRFTPPSDRREPTKVDVPGVPGAFLVLDVFTPEECLQIVQAAEAIGFEEDEAVQGSALQKTSILARNFVWLADKSVLSHFYNRILPFVPPNAPKNENGSGGGKVRGINARFRVYQYRENQVYRPHIDGAWPAAGLSETGEYLHDSSPLDDPLWSRYTLLVYLNSDIAKDTGSTTFFLPSDKLGVMETTSVRPIQGAVLCFPHGDTQGSLLHEGSAVGSDSGKFVIRTDLLYEAPGFGQFKPPKDP